MNFSGLCAFPITPTETGGHVHARELARLIARLQAARVDTIGLLGSTGSFAYLSRIQRRRAVEIARDVTGGKTPLLVGVGAVRTDDAITYASDAVRAGADALLLPPVSYLPLTDDEVVAHFSAVAGATPLPLCVYNNPATTHFTITPALLARLAAIPNVVAVKHPAPDSTAVATQHPQLVDVVDESFSVGYSVDWHAAEALIAGGQAWYSVAAGLFPAPCCAIVNALRDNDIATARQRNEALNPLWSLFREFSSFRVIYAAATHLGLTRSLPPRPVQPLPADVQHRVAATIDTLGLA